MSARETVREYYESLRRGEPLYPYFLESQATVKIGIGERLVGYDAVAEGLREQSRTTDNWAVESADLRVEEEDDAAWFADAVLMRWDDSSEDRRLEYETRWSGTLVRRGDEWLFATMHVSASVGGEGAARSVDGADFETDGDAERVAAGETVADDAGDDAGDADEGAN